jgi:AMP nucleosidase
MNMEGSLTAERRLLMRDVFDLPDLAAMDDGIANGTHEPPRARRSRCRCSRRRGGLFAAAPAPLHGTSCEHFQKFVLFTNYQFYIDEFIKLGHELMANPSGAPGDDYIAFVEPGNLVTRRVGSRCSRAMRWARRRRACRRCRAIT